MLPTSACTWRTISCSPAGPSASLLSICCNAALIRSSCVAQVSTTLDMASFRTSETKARTSSPVWLGDCRSGCRGTSLCDTVLAADDEIMRMSGLSNDM